MASDYLLQLDGVKGESKDKKHPNTIEIESFSWGASNSSASVPPAGGLGTGRASFQDFHITKKVDVSSPVLMLACATGQHIKSAKLYVRKSGEPTQTDYYKVTLTDVLISSFQCSGQGPTAGNLSSGLPTESLSINFNKIEFAYQQQLDDLTFLPAVQAGWDLKANKAV